MGAEIVLHEDDLAGLRKMRVGQVLEQVRIIDRRMPIGHLDVAPAVQWRMNKLAVPLRRYS